MTVRQAGTPTTDEQLDRAKREAAMKRMHEQLAWWTPESKPMDRIKCRLYPKLAFFFDGTGNNLYQELEKPVEERALSNVAKLFQAAIDDKDGQEAAARYFPGVGTPYRYHNSNISPNEDKGGPLGLGFGAGGDMRLAAALNEFKHILEIDWSAGALRHMQWVTLSVFGFSRGATLARAFVRRLIADQCLRTEDGLIWRGTYGERVKLRIVFMGLFDTVASVGGPGLRLDWGAELAIPPEVERCVHFVSGHEVRQAFPLDSVRVGETYPANCEEVVYPGVHSDVGGGYFDGFQGRSNWLSRIPLRDMYAEALRSGVMLESYAHIDDRIRNEMELLPDSPILGAYQAYMQSLRSDAPTLESHIHAHRTLHFRWRSALAKNGNDIRVLGALYRSVDLALCESVAARNNHRSCSPTHWKYELPRKPDDQAKQLLSEHRRLVRQLPSIRDPVEREADNVFPRPRSAYENLIVAAWDHLSELPGELEILFSEYVHDSVAHFTDWPCALHEQRGIFCDEVRVVAEAEKQQKSVYA